MVNIQRCFPENLVSFARCFTTTQQYVSWETDVGPFAQYLVMGGPGWNMHQLPNWYWSTYDINWGGYLQQAKAAGYLNAPPWRRRHYH